MDFAQDLQRFQFSTCFTRFQVHIEYEIERAEVKICSVSVFLRNRPTRNIFFGSPKSIYLENIVYHFFRQQWLLLGVKLMEINSNLFSRYQFLVFNSLAVGWAPGRSSSYSIHSTIYGLISHLEISYCGCNIPHTIHGTGIATYIYH